jgi:hypothetical protein
MSSGSVVDCADLAPDSVWTGERWTSILDRVEYREPDAGLRYWGPPLWLEVTMTGPDSDLWPTVSAEPMVWDWQSSAPCVEAADLASDGADDDCLLAVIARYTTDNLVLNAVHEIGEWFRFDGRRLFPAHSAGVTAGSADDQGNGAVMLQLEFGQAPLGSGAAPADVVPDLQRARRLVERLGEVARPSRFTYLPGTTISYEPAGPVVETWSGGRPTRAWRSTWSSSTLDAVDADSPEVIDLVGRDIHRALVSHEVDRICRAFCVDGRRVWRLDVPGVALGPHRPDTDVQDLEQLSITIRYADS